MIINPGSIGQPFFSWEKLCEDLRAQYSIIEVDGSGIADVQFKKVAYDVEQEIRRASENRLPYIDLYEESLTAGISHTHDEDLLKKINQEYHYEEEVRSFHNFQDC